MLCSITEEKTAVSLRFPHVFDFWGSIASFHCHTIIKTIQQIKLSQIKHDEYSNSLAKVQVCAMFRAGDIRSNIFLKFIKALYGDAMLPSLREEQMWRPEAKTYVIELYYNNLVVVF